MDEYLSGEQLRDLLAEFSYKPGWKFRLDDSLIRDEMVLWIEMEVLDSRGSGHFIPVISRQPIYCQRTVDQFTRWLCASIRQLEEHETDEWFRFRGQLLHDPHADDRVRA